MKVLVGFFIAVFVVSASREYHGRRLPMRWLLPATVFVAASFYSLRVIS